MRKTITSFFKSSIWFLIKILAGEGGARVFSMRSQKAHTAIWFYVVKPQAFGKTWFYLVKLRISLTFYFQT